MDKKVDIKSLPIPKTVLLSKNFREEFLSYQDFGLLLKQSTVTLKLIFNIISDLRNHVFFTGYYKGAENKDKMDLWNKEFCNEDESKIRLRYHVSSFIKSRDKNKMKGSLEFLKNFKNQEYSFINSLGKKITTSGGLIKDWHFEEKSGNFKISISTYWATKMVSLQVYNQFFMPLLNALSNNKQILFVTWLLELKNGKGTSLYTTLQERFEVNYTNRYEFCRCFLIPIKAKLDKQDMGVSFNYSCDKDSIDKIKFVVYTIKPVTDENESKEKQLKDKNISDRNNIDKTMIVYKARYYKKRHDLSVEDVKYIKELMKKDFNKFEQEYKVFVQQCKKDKIKTSDVQGSEFLKKLGKK